MRLTGVETMDVTYTQKMSHREVAEIIYGEDASVGYFPSAEKVQYLKIDVHVFAIYRLYFPLSLIQ